jgi:hypothetical protein
MSAVSSQLSAVSRYRCYPEAVAAGEEPASLPNIEAPYCVEGERLALPSFEPLAAGI